MPTSIEVVLQAILADFLKLIYAACAKIRKLDPSIALSTCLASMAAGVIGVRQVRDPKGRIEPLALIIFVSAPPVSGKSEARRLYFKPHFDHDEMRLSDYEQTRQNDKSARLREVVITDTNNRGLLVGLEGVGHTTTLNPLEGNSLLRSNFFRHQQETICALWDPCEKVNLAAEGGKRILAMNANVNVLVAAQPGKFGEYMDKYGQSAASVGLLQRTLPTLAPRSSLSANFQMDDADAVLADYYGKVAAFLTENYAMIQSGRVERETLEFDEGAAGEWHQAETEFSNKAAMQVNPAMAEAYGRAIQQVTRIAGILHCYFGETEQVTVETLRAATQIVGWYMQQLDRVMPFEQPKLPKLTVQEKQALREEEDCQKILTILGELEFNQRIAKPDVIGVPVSKLFTRCGIYRARFNTAYERLKDEHQITEIGKTPDVRALLAPQPRWQQPRHPRPFSSVSPAASNSYTSSGTL